MIYIALNVIFNALILAIVLIMGADLIHVKPYIAWCLGYVIVAILTIIGYTKIATSTIGLFMPRRKMIGRESDKLEPLFQDVINKTNNKYNTNYKFTDFNLKVSDNKLVNVFAIGYNTILINQGAIEKFTSEQLRAVLAREMGRLYYRDSVRSTALLFSSLGSRIIVVVYSIYLTFATFLSKSIKVQNSKNLTLISYAPLLVFLPIIILNWIGVKLFNLLNLRLSKGAQYRADAFAVNLGYKDDLISAIEVLDTIITHDNSLISKLMSSHSTTMSRIGAIEDEKIAPSNLSTPFVATNLPYIGGNSEIVRLSVILGFIGGLWCYLGIFY